MRNADEKPSTGCGQNGLFLMKITLEPAAGAAGCAPLKQPPPTAGPASEIRLRPNKLFIENNH
jgi:hypothetical protein